MDATRVAARAMPMPAAAPAPAPSSVPSSGPSSSGAARARLPQRANARQNGTKRRNNPGANLVIVTGYPPYTTAADLLRVFSKFGLAKVENLNNESATISYPNGDNAGKAIEASTAVTVYGEFLTVAPVVGQQPGQEDQRPQPHHPKRDFPRSKEKNVIIAAKDIDLSGSFHEQLERVLAAVRLTQEQVAALCTLYTHLENALRHQWPGCSAVPFGSIPTGLGIKTSDADCFINIPVHLRPNIANPDPVNVANAHANLVNKAQRVLRQYPQIFAETLAIPRANTPIVKFFHIPTQTNCDVTFKTPLGAQNSKLIAFLLHSDPRLLPVAVVIKYWAKVHELSGTGKLTNYALTMLVIFYLQQPDVGILPSVQWLQREAAHDHPVDGWNTGFSRASLPPATDGASIPDLLGGFFTFYSTFNFEEQVVCPYLGRPVKKELFKDSNLVPAEFERYKFNVASCYVLPMRINTAMCVQDPFEQCHNVALPITGRLASDIKAYFKFAASAYEKEKLNNCTGFFQEILLQKPKIVRGKLHPEFRVNLFPRFITNIIDPDWKPIVQQVIRDIFENMLKIKLTKTDVIPKLDPLNPNTDTNNRNSDPRKEKERYTGAVTKAIWKRKQFSKLYSMTKLKFQQKQARITEEILNVDKQEVGFEFLLLITYCKDPKSVVMLIKLTSGDLDIFREFGKFFVTVVHHWCIELLKPHTKPMDKDMAAKIADTIQFLDKNLIGNDEEQAGSDDDTSSSLNVSTRSDDGPDATRTRHDHDDDDDATEPGGARRGSPSPTH